MHKEKHGRVRESHHPEITLVYILVYFQVFFLHLLCQVLQVQVTICLGDISMSCATFLQPDFNGDVIYPPTPLIIYVLLFFFHL